MVGYPPKVDTQESPDSRKQGVCRKTERENAGISHRDYNSPCRKARIEGEKR